MATAKKTEAPVKTGFQKPTERDFAIIKKPVITEKSMAQMQGNNKVTLRVIDDTNKAEVKLAFERIFQVKVVDVRILNVKPKLTTRGTRYHGAIQGYKKAIVTIAEGEAIDLFKE
ncbi:MAG: 50S ribosomal protein L23 [Bacilli bacterium]|nr:50S ribosomal protein L23 [Bacilli bacterium]